MAALAPLSSLELEERLEELLDAVLSSRRTAAGIARSLAFLSRAQQAFVLRWTDVVTRTNPELAYQFVARAPQALAAIGEVGVEAWVLRAMDAYDQHGLYRGTAVLKDLQQYVAEGRVGPHAVTFQEIAHPSALFLHGLAGRPLRIEQAQEIWTDTETVFLPPVIAVFDHRAKNSLAYRAACAHAWAQIRFGTFRRDLVAATAAFANPPQALRVLSYLEAYRLDACIDRSLPGLGKDMLALRGSAHPLTATQRRQLADPNARIDDSLMVLAQIGIEAPITLPCYAALLVPDQVARVARSRIAREKAALQSALADVLAGSAVGRHETETGGTPRFSVEPMRTGLSEQPSLLIDGKQLPAMPSHIANLLRSITDDLGHVPDDYLVPAGSGAYDAARSQIPESATNVWKGTYHEQGAYLYKEWDYRRKHYRKDWCVLREIDVHPGDPVFVQTTLTKHRPVVARLKRTFELLRGEEKLLKRQKNGDDIDLDALVSAHAERRCGMEFPEALLTRRRRAERSTAVMFMVDMSGSTKGWVNDAERESLVLLCEALEILGDRYAIYGFSGMTRKRCEIYRVKRFSEPYSQEVRRRVAGIQPQGYTRMGAAVRHLSGLLAMEDARTKLLITLSDGKPDDYSDNYRGEYGIEDTRQALFEAQHRDIHPFCITIDQESRAYLPHMYGAANYALVSDVSTLPLKVAEIYRRLTA